MDILDRIKEECKKHYVTCYGCVFCNGHCVFEHQPDKWDAGAIRDAFGEEGKIDVPEKFPSYAVHSLADNVDNCSREKMNEIIDCLENMKLALNSTMANNCELMANKREKERE